MSMDDDSSDLHHCKWDGQNFVWLEANFSQVQPLVHAFQKQLEVLNQASRRPRPAQLKQ
jgi:hypothetical protein